jgi:hypothetical protein
MWRVGSAQCTQAIRARIALVATLAALTVAAWLSEGAIRRLLGSPFDG